MRILQIVVVLALLPIIAFYLYPRIYGLTATPYRLDKAGEYGKLYNPRLFEVANHEQVTLAAFDSLDHVEALVSNVRTVDEKVANELNILISAVRRDLAATLTNAGAKVNGLVAALDGLGAQINAANGPVNGASSSLAADRAKLGAILNTARPIAAKVHAARVAAEDVAHNVSGR
ncbi:MAG TPA: hypothetical protein VLJ59_01240 [Mycobacteriales bacterium]|nr:hypothetical protein [Mycobacteriales bacterium]